MSQCPISERLHYLTYIGALISLPVEDMSHPAREHGNVTVLSAKNSVALCLPLSFSSFFFPHANIYKKKKKNFLHCLLQLSNILFSLALCVPLLPYFILPIFLLPLLPVCFCQMSPCQSAVAMCRSGTSPRETVGLTTWRSASAGDAVCPGLMSSWRYEEETSARTHTQKILLSEHEATLTNIDFNMSDNW